MNAAALIAAGVLAVGILVFAIRAADRHAKRHRVAGTEPLKLPPRKVRTDRAAQSRRRSRARRKRAS